MRFVGRYLRHGARQPPAGVDILVARQHGVQDRVDELGPERVERARDAGRAELRGEEPIEVIRAPGQELGKLRHYDAFAFAFDG